MKESNLIKKYSPYFQVFKRIFNDPYLDWFIILMFLFLSMIFSGIWGANVYKKAVTFLNEEGTKTANIKRVGFDEKKMNEILESFRNKKKIFSDQASIKILLRDPSI